MCSNAHGDQKQCKNRKSVPLRERPKRKGRWRSTAVGRLGLKKGKRHRVHLSKDIEAATIAKGALLVEGDA
jgi:hypothetical protein